MLPQIYQTTDNFNIIDTAEQIFKKNKDSNDEILKLRESGQYKQEHFKELTYHVNPIPDFITLPDKKATYSILDMPGLNCGGGDNMYFNYIKQNSEKIDVYILVFDVNSGLNTTDEVKILQDVNAEIVKNKHGYVHILINKCDEVEYDNKNKFKFTDEEIEELYNTCVTTANKYLKDVRGNITISPLCSNELYVYRGAIHNIDTLDEKQLDNIIKAEVGKKEFSKLTTHDLKKKYLSGLIKDKKSTLCNDWMKDTGYNLFKQLLNNMFTNYTNIIFKHIDMDLTKLQSITISDFDIVSNKLEEINMRISDIASINNKKVKEFVPDYISEKIKKITNMLDIYLINGINSYSASTVENADTFIDKIGKFFGKIKNLFASNPLEKSETQLKQKRIELLNNKLSTCFDENIFKELYTNNTIIFHQYVTCVSNTITQNQMSIDTLLKSVSIITKNNKDFIDVIISNFTNNYKSTDFTSFYVTLTQISKICNNNLEIITKIIKCHFENIIDTTKYNIYDNWINMNSHYILNESYDIQYLYYMIKLVLKKKTCDRLTNIVDITTFDMFKISNKDMDGLFSILCKLIGNKITVKLTEIKQSESKNDSHKEKKTDKQNIMKSYESYESDEDFQDAHNNSESEESTNEHSENYNSNDDSDGVYKKAMKNTQIRTVRRIKKGGDILFK
jgi:hypothetical protein